MKNTAFLCGVFRLHLFWRHRLEVPPRFELGSGAFAELCLTTWLWHHFVQGMRFRGRILPREKTGQSFFAPFGASDEARTRYLHLGKVALYQMSYTRIWVPRRENCGGWCLRSESNQRHEDFQSSALPTELQRHMATHEAFTPHGSFVGDPERARTVDL